MEKNYSGEIYEALNADLENASKNTLLDMRDKLKAYLTNCYCIGEVKIFGMAMALTREGLIRDRR